MSWLVLMIRVPESIRSVAELPRDFVPEPLGTRAEVIAFIRSLFQLRIIRIPVGFKGMRNVSLKS
jgi:hypothetical protein